MTAAQVPLEMVRFDRVMEREYQKVHPYQFVRELVQNALDAGATEVTVGPCWPLIDPKDDPSEDQHWALCVCDNGHGMAVPDADDPDQVDGDSLVGIMRRLSDTTKGDTGGTGGHECFGVGSRLSTLPWTDSLVISYPRGGGGSGSMVHLTRSEGDGRWCMSEYIYDSDTGCLTPEGDGDASQEWWTEIPSELREFHRSQVLTPEGSPLEGTMVILLGRGTRVTGGHLSGVPAVTETTLWGSGGVCENVRYLSKYLNQRYMDIPDGVSVRVYESRFRDKSGWRDHQQRTVRGVRHFWDRHQQTSGEVVLEDGTKVEWWLFPDGKGLGGLQTNHAYAYTSRVIGLRVHDEVLHEQGRLPGRGWVTWAQFGLSGMTVRDRMSLMVTPPLDRVVMDTGRTHVYWREGDGSHPGDFPWERWGAEFKVRMPKVLRDFVADSVSAEDATLQDRVESGAWKHIESVKGLYPKPPKKPHGAGSKTPPPTGGTDAEGAGRGVPTGKKNVSRRRIILDSDLEAAADTPALYLPGQRELRVYTKHPIHQSLVDHYLSVYNSTGGDGRLESTIRAAVYEVIVSDYGSMVFNGIALKSHRETRQHWREMVAAPGILAVAYTLHSRQRVLDVLVASRVKGLAKRQKGKK